MKTGSLKTYYGPGAIRVSIGRPRFRPDGQTMPYCRALYPLSAWLKMGYADYRPRYDAMLGQLVARDVWADLHKLVHPHEPVILCFEVLSPTSGAWCHRRMVADWLHRELGEVVPEVEIGRPPGKSKASQLLLL